MSEAVAGVQISVADALQRVIDMWDCDKVVLTKLRGCPWHIRMELKDGTVQTADFERLDDLGNVKIE